MNVLAHASHWLVQAVYLAPVVLLVVVLVWSQLRDRRERKQAAGPDAPVSEAGRGTTGPGEVGRDAAIEEQRRGTAARSFDS